MKKYLLRRSVQWLVVARAATGGTIATLRVPYREMVLEAGDAGEQRIW